MLARPTIARDLTVGLIGVMSLVFALSGALNYFYTQWRDESVLRTKAAEVASNITNVLATPTWNVNLLEIRRVIDVYSQFEGIREIKVFDEAGIELVGKTIASRPAFFGIRETIYFKNSNIGTVQITFSDAEIKSSHERAVVYTVAMFGFLAIALGIATSFLLRRFLTRPFQALIDGLTIIAFGKYDHTFPLARQEDINAITRQVTNMAEAIAQREDSLEENQRQVEVLNDAIVTLFSCPDATSLTRMTMIIIHRLCGNLSAIFEPSSIRSGQPSPTPIPSIVQFKGVFLEGDSARPGAGITEATETHEIAIETMEHHFGKLVISFSEKAERSTMTLIHSLTSVTSQALSRLGLIHGNATIAAELQVAETVQRAMLFSEQVLSLQARVAYHYSPVHRVGGDWFKLIDSRDRTSVYVIMGDVTGHGLAQGLVTTAMSGAINVIESIVHDHDASHLDSPSQIVNHLDQLIRRLASHSNLRMTCVVVKIDFATMNLSICNAGHTFPLLVRSLDEGFTLQALTRMQQQMLGDGTSESSPPAGANLARLYQDATYSFSAHDRLILYTDGLTEAVNASGESFQRKFIRMLKRNTASDVGEIKQEILNAFQNHVGATPVADDVCLLIIGKGDEETPRALGLSG